MNAIVPASKLAMVAQQGEAVTAQQTQYLTFMLGGEMFAIGILAIKEIIEYGSVTAVPMMPAFIRGVINLRGEVVPVMDLALRCGKASSEVTKRTCVIIVEVTSGNERHDVGVVVDAVSEVLEIALADIEPPPAFGARIRTEFIQAMGKVRGKFVILLATDQVLAIDDVTQLGKADAVPAVAA